MTASSQVRLVFSAIVLITALTGQAFGQGTLVRPTPESATRDSSGNLKRPDTVLAPEKMIRGLVLLADGSVPEHLVEIFSDCGEVQNLVATADSKGRFTFNLDALNNAGKGKNCVLRAFLEGYRSETKPVADMNSKSGERAGKIVLQPLCSDANGLISIADRQASKAQTKMYDKAINEAAKGDWRSAIGSLDKVTAAYPGYSSAWLSLGILQGSHGDPSAAEKSFLESVRADQKFAPPLIQAATLEAAQSNWRATLAHSEKAIGLNPAAFPDAYALNAMANVSLQNIDAAEKSAREGLRLDTAHQYPELEYSLGIVLYSKGDLEGAMKHLYSYVSRAPNGPNAGAARKELAQLQTAATAGSPDTIKNQNSQPAKLSSPGERGPSTALLQDRNAALLAKTPAHTCLETISRAQLDTRGGRHDADLTRVEIGVSEGKEIYGYVDGKHFSNERLSAMLGYTFSTTGLFSSIARALIAGNDASITFAGKEVLNGESVLRYNFQVVPGQGGWSIHYGKESGTAGEQGWFLVDSLNLILRRVVVYAVDIPRILKLKELNAVIDYEPETVADSRVLLPYVARVHVQEASGKERVSRMFFNHCRAFTAESTVLFDVNNTHLQGDQPSGRPDLPPDLDIAVSLASPISRAAAAANDVLTATVAAPVSSKGREIIARGAVLEGHLRPCRGENAVIIELDRVRTRDGWAPFYARMVSVASINQASAENAGPQRNADPEIPGVAKISFTGKSAELAAGTQMVWRTEPLVMPAEAHAPQLNTSMDMH